MDAIASWQAVLTTLGGERDGDNVAARRAVAHALTPAPPAPAAGGKEAFYTPLPAAQTGTPVDEWHSILTALTGNAKAVQGRTAGASGSPAGSSGTASPAGSAAGQASPFGSASMVRQLFSSTPHSSRPEHASSSTGSTPRHGLPQPQTANGATPGTSSPGVKPAATAAQGCPRPSPALHPNPAAPLSAAGLQASASHRVLDTQHLADRLHGLRASAESVLQTVTQAAGSPAAKQAGHTTVATTAAPARLSGGASSSSFSAAGPQEGGALQRQLFLPAATSGTRCSSASGSTPASPLRRLLQSAQQARDAQHMQQPPVPAVVLASTRMGLDVAHGSEVQPQDSHAQQQQALQQLLLQQLLLQQQQLIQQLLPLIPGLSQQQSAGGAAAPCSDSAEGASRPERGQPQKMQQEQLLQLAKLLQAASRAEEVQRGGQSASSRLGDSAVQLPGPAGSSDNARAGGMRARAAGERGSVEADSSSSGGGSDHSSSGRGQVGSGDYGNRRRRWQQSSSAGVAGRSAPAHTGQSQQQEGRPLEAAAGAAGASTSRGWTATGSKSLSAGAAGSAATCPRFLSQQQHVRLDTGSSSTSSSSSLLVQALDLPQVVRFRGLHSTDGGAASSETPPHEGDRHTSSSASNGGAAQNPVASDAGDVQQAGTDAGMGSAVHAAGDAGAAGGAGSADCSEEPETPTAALPRVHTPGKPAAEVAADLSTPQLAHSAAAVMTVSEAWREEASGANARWQQLLAEWSAAEVDTWGSQRLTEPSAVGSQNSRLTEPSAVGSQNSRLTEPSAVGSQNSRLTEPSAVSSQRSRLSSMPGLDLSQLSSNASVGAAAAPLPSTSQHRLSRGSVLQHNAGCSVAGADGSAAAAAAGGRSLSGGGGDDAATARTDMQPAGASREAVSQQREGEQQVTFASLAREQDLSPRRMPSDGIALQVQETCQSEEEARQLRVHGPPGEARRMSCETGAPVEADASEVSLFCPAPQPGAVQQEQQDLAAAQAAPVPQPSSPASPDTTRKQLFTSAADSCSASTRSRSSSVELGAPGVASDAAAPGNSSGAATRTPPPAATACAAADQSRAGPAVAGRAAGSAADAAVDGSGAAGSQVEGGDRLQRQEEEGLEKLSQLLHDLQGLQHRLQTIQLQSPRHRQQETPDVPDTAAAAAAAAPATAAGAEAGRSALQSGSTASAAAVAAAGSAGNQPARPGTTAAALNGGFGGAATPDQAAPAALVLSAATEARAATAVSRMTQLKQRLQDSRVALQALTSPRAGAAGATAADCSLPIPGQQPVLVANAAAPAHATAGGSTGLTAQVPTNQAARSTAVGCAGSVNTPTAAAPAASASAWLTGGPLQQYLERRSSAGRVSGDGRGPGSSWAFGAAAGSGSHAGISHVQALVSKWRAAAAAEQHLDAQASQPQQQQPAEGFGLAGQVPSGPVQAAGAAQPMRGIAGSAHNVPEWLSATPAVSHLQQLAASRSAGGAAGPGLGQAAGLASPHRGGTPLSQGPLGSAGRVSGSRGNSEGLRSGGSHTAGSAVRISMGAASGGAGSAGGGFDAVGSSWSLHNPLFQHTHISTKPTPSASRRAGCYSSGSSSGGSRVGAGLQGLATVGTGCNSKTGTRCSSTPPSTGALARWSQQGSPTRQLRQQLQATAQQFQLQQQERDRAQQQWVAGLQVTPVAASLAKSFATVDATLAGLSSVSPVRTAPGQRSGAAAELPRTTPPCLSRSSQLTPGSGGSQGDSVSGLFGGAAGASSMRSSGRSAADILAGTAAAAQEGAARSSLGAARAQVAAGRPMSPVRMLRRQQEMLASIGMLCKPTR